MKSLLLTLALALGATTVSAQNFDSLKLQQKDGTEKTISLEGLKITFNNGNLVAANAKQTETVSLDKMAKMYFFDTTTGIDDATVAAGEVSVSIVNGKLNVEAPKGSSVRVYNVEGRQMQQDNLQKGVYIVRVNDQTFKVLAR